jgi:hypothetical protein
MCIMLLSVFLADPDEGRYVMHLFNARLAYLFNDRRGPPIQVSEH